MKRFLIVIVAMVCAMTATAQQNTYLLESGRNIPIRLTSDLTSNTREIASITPSAIVDANIYAADGTTILIARGTPVDLDITIEKARGVGRPGILKVEPVSIRAVDGQTIYLMGGTIFEGEQRKGLAIGLGVGLGILVCPPCLFCLCIKGEQAEVPANTMLRNIVVNSTYHIAAK